MENIKMEERVKKYEKIIAKAWADEDFKKKLISNTDSVLKDEGIEIPKGIQMKAIEEPANTKFFIIPLKPDNIEGINNVEERTCGMCSTD